jgi:hypothetical protein
MKLAPDVRVAFLGRAAASRSSDVPALLGGARDVTAVGELADERTQAVAGGGFVPVLSPERGFVPERIVACGGVPELAV